MNIPKNKDETFYADINIFFSTYLPVYIHKVFNFALYQQGVNSILPFDRACIDNEDNKQSIFHLSFRSYGFSTDDYKKASLSAYDEDSNEIHEEKTIKSTFDLSGYEIVRAQFFSTRFDPAVTISSGKIAFNTACMKKFENVEYVELLFNSVEKCIAVRPCEKSNVNAIKWGTIRNGRWAVLPKSCKGFSEPLFELMNWDSDCKYKLRGQFCGNSDEQLLIFELEEPEVFVQEYVDEQHIDSSVEAPSENMKTVKKVLYPKAWIHNFGETTNRTVFLQRVAYKGNWEILRPAKTVEGMEIITRKILDDLIDEAEKLIDRMRCATYE